jgi:hypothetical protein
MQSHYSDISDIRPTTFKLYRSDWTGNHIKVWEGRCCYLTDALEAYRAICGGLNSIALASFERLDVPLSRVYSSTELQAEIAWVQRGVKNEQLP